MIADLREATALHSLEAWYAYRTVPVQVEALPPVGSLVTHVPGCIDSCVQDHGGPKFSNKMVFAKDESQPVALTELPSRSHGREAVARLVL